MFRLFAFKIMEIRDIIHGAILIEPYELPVIDSRHFQRLREIKQLGFAEFSFPSATHNRYVHSLGAMETATRAFDTIFGGPSARVAHLSTDTLHNNQPATYARFRAVLRLAALLHDIGHGPLSHTSEVAMPDVKTLAVPFVKPRNKPRKATHEDYTLKMILDSALTGILEKAGSSFGFRPLHIAALIEASIELPKDDHFFKDQLQGETVDFRPLLNQLISSEIDADRMDYLRRDSLHSGVSYGQFDFDWLVGNLSHHVNEGRCFLGLNHRAIYAFEDFLISRFHMFLMVYFHYKSIVFDSMLGKYLESPDCDYTLPADIEQYCEHTDTRLFAHLAKSSNPWARRITEKRYYRMLVELHSGIPTGKTAFQEQQRLLEQIRGSLDERKIDFISSTSTSEISKYFRKPGDPIYVLYDNHYSAPSFIPLEQCTDLFQRYSEKRSITRLYVSPEDYPLCRDAGRQTPLRYEEEFLPTTST
ncbi:MAG: hypothetical protein A2Z97_08770 [Bdellovibrionales bacterium GWB1_52_6]|nr:MAG: hypothetical protein A2Z97_08770 [Bdellovibrionales bacterium GWB1_52_6]OFZ06338.1 MAG: hypothetical protein A2X97_02640 [Bdellovibrionales bacterium GWA1_52_35]